MSSTTSPIVSPPPLLATRGFPDRERLPSQSSTSQLAPASQTTSSVPQLASARYVRQFREFLDHQRELFNEERALWQIERSELHDHIVRLEESLQQARNTSSSQTSPTGISQSGRRFSSLSRSGNVGCTGDEFWRGAKTDAHPTRVFSSVSTEGQHLPSILENVPPHELAGASSSPVQRTTIPGPRISEIENSRGTFDGINFRQNSRAPSVATTGITQESPSGSQVSPRTISLPSRLGPPEEYITEHAGHTPLARGSRNDTDGTPDAVTSSTPTPTELLREKPPYKPHASFARPPSERSESYFAGIVANTAEDPALSEPLTLGDTSAAEAQSFLKQVDTRLEEAVRHEQNNSSKQGAPNPSAIISDPPEQEPPLRIKRSMNFGSQLGGSKGF